MGLLKKFLGAKDGAGATETTPGSLQFHESESTQDEAESRNAPRRERVQVVLRDTMRRHGIPSDWIQCRILSTVTKSGRPGMHVSFVVLQAHERLLGYVFAFQDSFLSELARVELKAEEWLTIGWEFTGYGPRKAAMPSPSTWGAAGPPAPAQPAAADAPIPAPELAARPPAADAEDDIEQDLRALFAIRDAALKDELPPEPQPDFEPTRPGADESDQPHRH